MAHEDLRQEIWHCVRLWLYDYFFTNDYPYGPANWYSFTPAVYHGLSHWKQWMQRKPEFREERLETCYLKRSFDNQAREAVTTLYGPDCGEYTMNLGRPDYILRKESGQDVICAVEVEQVTAHISNDLCKLLDIKSPLKVLIHRPPVKYAIERMKASGDLRDIGTNEDWLFISIPWYEKPDRWPRTATEARVEIYTCDRSLVLTKPTWDIWASASEMDKWVRSLPEYQKSQQTCS